ARRVERVSLSSMGGEGRGAFHESRTTGAMQLVANIVVLTAIYGLICCGYVLAYRVSRVLNLAHGEIMMVGGYLLLTLALLLGGDPIVALVVALVLSLALGIGLYLLLMRRMTGE